MTLAATFIGSNSVAAGGNSIAKALTADIQTGDLVVAIVSHKTSNTNQISSIGDGTNTYVLADSCFGDGSTINGGLYLYYVKNAVAVASPTVTVNFSSSPLDRFLSVVRVSGTDPASPLDKHSFARQASSATPSIATAALSQAEQIAFGVVSANAQPTVTEASGWTNDANTQSGDGNVTNTTGHLIVNSVAAVTYNPTFNTAKTSLMGVATFLAATTLRAFSNSDDLSPARKQRPQNDPTFVSTAYANAVVGPSGVEWSQRFEEFKGKPKFTDQPAYGIPPVPAVGVSGVAFTQPLDYATPKKGRTDPAAMDPQFVAAVGISGVSWALRLDLAVPKKGRTEPPAYDPRSIPAVGISGIDWSQRFEPMFGKPIRLTMPPAYGIPPVPAVGISGVDWSQRSEPFFGRKAFTDPPVWTINIELVRVNPAIRPHGAVPKWRFLG